MSTREPKEIRALCQRRDHIQASSREYETDGESNLGKYRRIQDRKDRIQASTKEEIVSGRVLDNKRQTGDRIRASTGESKIKRIVFE